MPELSTMMRSKPADWQMAMDWTMCCDQRAVGLAGGEGAHEDAVGAEGVEPDAVAEESAAGAAFGRVDGEDGDGGLGVVGEEAQDELVGERGLAGAAGAGGAEDGRGFDWRQGADLEAVLGAGDGAGDGEPAVGGGADGPGEVDLARG